MTRHPAGRLIDLNVMRLSDTHAMFGTQILISDLAGASHAIPPV